MLTHDEAENPQGMTGCGVLSFGPFALAQPTTEAAQSAFGLELSLAFADEGLVNPGGVAESQLRDLVLALPEGMSVDSSAGATEVCSESELQEETPEAVEGGGCPPGSAVGTLEVESPLLAGETLHGVIYQGSHIGVLGSSATWTLYAVARNADLGILITQPLELEPEPETGQLVAYAEDLPQYPFSRIDLQLFDNGSSPLITPARCGDYEIEALLTPWAEDVDYRLLSEFSLDTGPDGGPCPSGAATEPSDYTGPTPAASAPAASVAAPPSVIRRKARRCPKGKRAVRRKGRSRCVRRCRRGRRLVRRKGKLRCVKVKRHKHRRHRRKR